MQQTYVSGVGTTPNTPILHKNNMLRAYTSMVDQLKSSLGSSNNLHPMFSNSSINHYSDQGRKDLATTLSNQYKLAMAQALQQNNLQLQHITNPGQDTNSNPRSAFAIVQNASQQSLSDYEAFNKQHPGADQQINTDYANALGKFSASIDNAVKSLVEAAIAKIENTEKTEEWKAKMQRQRLIMPLATAAVYAVPITGLIAGSVMASEAELMQIQLQAMVDTLPQDVIESITQKYYANCGFVDPIYVVYSRWYGYDFYYALGLNDAHRLTVRQIQELCEVQQGNLVGGALLIAFSTIAIVTLWTMMYGDQTQRVIQKERNIMIDSALADGNFAEKFQIGDKFVAPQASTIMAENQVDKSRLAAQMAAADVQINTKASLLFYALSHEQTQVTVKS